MAINHRFIIGDIVTYKGNMGEVISRGAVPGRQFVQILFTNGTRLDVNNDDIKKIRKA